MVFKATSILFLIFFYCSNLLADSSGATPVVSLVFSAEDNKHALEVLNSAISLAKKIKVTNVVMVVNKNKLANFAPLIDPNFGKTEKKAPISPEQKILSETYRKYYHSLGLEESIINTDQALISRLRLSYSPAWIIRYKGKDYIFEGYQDISQYFSHDGRFNY